MAINSTQSWLQKLDEQLNVDVDWMDPTYSKNLQIVPHDMTSNNLWVNEQMSHPDNAEMVREVCKELKSEGWKAAYTRIVRRPSHRLSSYTDQTTSGSVDVQSQY